MIFSQTKGGVSVTVLKIPLFFSPALGMLSEIVPTRTRSFHIGLFNGSFNIGAGIGILGWTYLDSVYSWRFPLELAGMIMIGVAVLNFGMVSGIPQSHRSDTSLTSRVNVALRTRILWILPLAVLIGILAETITGQLFVYYAEVHLNMADGLARNRSSKLVERPDSITKVPSMMRPRKDVILLPILEAMTPPAI